MRRRMIWLHALIGLAAVALVAPARGQFWEVDNYLLQQEQPPDPNAWFGMEVAVGDFDGDGRDDLAVGAPLWTSPYSTLAGEVRFYRGMAGRTFPYLGDPEPSYDTTSAYFGFALAAGDFDGDGSDEVAIGAPLREVDHDGNTITDAGQVGVYNYTSGAWSLWDSLTQNDTLNYTIPEDEDRFGWNLVAGDFNDDSYDDLVVTASQEGWAPLGLEMIGVVHVFYGSASGLATGTTFVPGVNLAGTPGDYDYLGTALAVGDFDDDGYDDLAIGTPDRDTGGLANSGEINIVYGSSTGLTTTGEQLISKADVDGGGVTEAGDRFGDALAAGGFDDFLCLIGTCFDDLAIGIPGQRIDSVAGAGMVMVLPGSASGVQTTNWSMLSALSTASVPELDDQFGAELAAGHVDPSRYVDLVVGSPKEDTGGLTDVGYVHLFFGAADGLDSGPTEQPLPERNWYAIGPAETADYWGDTLAIGDFDGDGWGDLVVGVSSKNLGGNNTGAVQILFGGLFAESFERGSTAGWSSAVP